jgi:peptide/nickel transport system substrate-binding protein
MPGESPLDRASLRRRPLLGGLLAGLAAPWPGFAAATPAPAVDRETLVVGVEKDFQSLNGLVVASGDSQRYAWSVFDTLSSFDSAGHLVLRLATDVAIAPDRLSYTYRLRSGVKFHNGATMTSRDVKTSLEYILRPENRSSRRPFFAPFVAGIDTPDDLTVVFRLTQEDGVFVNKIAGYLLIATADHLASASAFAQAPVSLGAWRVKSLEPGRALELERFEDYWGPKPAVRNLVFRVIPEPGSRVAALSTGEIDIAVVVPLPDTKALRAEPGLHVLAAPMASPLHVHLYTEQPDSPLSRREVRQALNYAIDERAIIDSVLDGVGEPLATFISRYYPYSTDPALAPYPYDPEKAQALLKQAGYPGGFTTKLYSPNDQPVELAEAIAAYWEQVGVKAAIQRMDYESWLKLMNAHKAEPMAITQSTNTIYDAVHPVSGHFYPGGPYADYFNPEVKALVDEVNHTYGAEARGQVFQKIGRILHDDASSVFISELYYVYAWKQGLNWSPQIGSGFLDFRAARWA